MNIEQKRFGTTDVCMLLYMYQRVLHVCFYVVWSCEWAHLLLYWLSWQRADWSAGRNRSAQVSSRHLARVRPSRLQDMLTQKKARTLPSPRPALGRCDNVVNIMPSTSSSFRICRHIIYSWHVFMATHWDVTWRHCITREHTSLNNYIVLCSAINSCLLLLHDHLENKSLSLFYSPTAALLFCCDLCSLSYSYRGR